MKLKGITGFCTAALLLLSAGSAFASTKNVILMISDGQGFNTVKATDYYTGKTAVYENFSTKLAMQTTSASNSAGYDPAMMAGNFNYSLSGATDSASAATAMYTGQKIFDGRINYNTDNRLLTTYFEAAALAGKSTGAVSSVEFSHATPAAVAAHNISRNNYAEIANEMIYNSPLDVIMGAGYPTQGQTKYIGGSPVMDDIADGSTTAGHTFINDVADFQALADGSLSAAKILGVANANATLSENYKPGSNDESVVPTLETMTKGALNVLSQNDNGFTVMIEGGAVDWEGHGNNLQAQIIEQIDFNNSVQAVVDWVLANSNWDETLLIVTADHETGGLYGDGSAGFFDVDKDGIYTEGVDYAHMGDNGAGNVPEAFWASGGHTNQLVPLYAMGAGSDLLFNHVIGTDTNLPGYYGLGSDWTGDYIDNTAIFSVMSASAVPVPGACWIMASGLLGLVVLRRKAMESS